MTSTDLHIEAQRLPLLPGLLEDMHAQALRARIRRVMTAAQAEQNLAALKTSDEKIDEVIQACSLYGGSASHYFASQTLVPEKIPGQRGAAVFLQLALAVQINDPSLLELINNYWPLYPQDTLDALWFFPVPRNLFDVRQQHLALLCQAQQVQQSAQQAYSLAPLVLELIGRCDYQAGRGYAEAQLSNPNLAGAALLALARLGANIDLQALAEQAFSRPAEDNAWLDVLLHIITCQPRAASDALLQQLQTQAAARAELAWAILAMRYPRHTLHAAPLSLVPEWRWRMLGICGGIEDILQGLHKLSTSLVPLQAVECDFILLSLGDVPPQAKQTPFDQAAWQAALHTLFLNVMRANGIALAPGAQYLQGDAAWDAKQLFAGPIPALRLRHGRPLRAIPALSPEILGLSHGSRQWLYLERAELARHRFSLQALDVYRRQQNVLMVAEVSDAF